MNNNIKFAVVSAIIKAYSINGKSFQVNDAEAVIFDSAKEALAAFEAAETVALIVIADDMNEQVCEDLGLTRLTGWPWYKGQSKGATYWQGRDRWYYTDPMIWSMSKGKVSSATWRAGFVALMRAAW